MLPMGLATIIGGMSTTIGTSTNLLVVGIANDMGQHEFTMFEWVLPVAIVGGAAIIFLWLIAPRTAAGSRAAHVRIRRRAFSVAQLHIKEGGFSDGKTLSEVLKKTDGEMRVDKIQRSESLFLAKLPSGKDAAGRSPVREGLAREPQTLRATTWCHALQHLGCTSIRSMTSSAC